MDWGVPSWSQRLEKSGTLLFYYKHFRRGFVKQKRGTLLFFLQFYFQSNILSDKNGISLKLDYVLL